jgi:hypothetical protein
MPCLVHHIIELLPASGRIAQRLDGQDKTRSDRQGLHTAALMIARNRGFSGGVDSDD